MWCESGSSPILHVIANIPALFLEQFFPLILASLAKNNLTINVRVFSGLSVLFFWSLPIFMPMYFYYVLITVALEVPSDCIGILGWVFLFLQKNIFGILISIALTF